jgi:glycosyltransferase involved in cell wall biosynthesis
VFRLSCNSYQKVMKTQPAITVLMPVYNASEYLQEAVDSVLTQTWSDFELLIIDDGSDQKTKGIIASIIDERVRVITHLENLGLITSLNEGLKSANGRYIARMDADDVCLPERLEKQFRFLEKNPTILLCGCQIEEYSGKSAISKVLLDHDMVKAGLLFSCVIPHPSVMFRKEVFDKENFEYDRRFVHSEDYELWIRVSRKFRLCNLKDTLLKYRVHPGQVSAKYAEAQHEGIRKCHEIQLNYMGVQFSSEELERHYLLSTLQFEPTPQFLNQMSAWFSKILVANRNSGYLKQSALRSVIGRWWYVLVATLIDRKAPVKQAAMQSSLTLTVLDPWQQLRLLYRLILK